MHEDVLACSVVVSVCICRIKAPLHLPVHYHPLSGPSFDPSAKGIFLWKLEKIGGVKRENIPPVKGTASQGRRS